MWSWPWGSSTDEAREGGFKLGEVVEYYSASQGAWIPAKVVAVKPNSYDLDCKPDVPPARIRSCASARDSRVSSSGLLEFEPGDVVEYFSISQNDWILAKVLSINASGTYNLDCKPEVPPERVRAQRGSDLVISPVSVSKPRSLRQAGTIFDLCQVQDLDEPIQLLRLQKASQRWRYELCPEGLRALEAYGGRKIAVVSVCGPSNSGKSYLLNVLLGRVEESLPAFKVGTRRTGSCTDGLWLWAHRDPDDENAPILAYLDCAGFGVSDRSCDGQLMTLCALMSSVMILNTKGTLGEAVFNSLACVTRLAEHLQERGQDVSRPALLWVLRDFTLDLRDAAGSLMSPEEYLEQALHAANPGTEEVRKSLLRFFNHRSCTTLVQPVFEEAQLKSLPEKPYKSLRSEFRAAVEAVQAQLIATCHLHPKTVAGQVLGASSYAALLKQLVEAMNEQKPLNVRNAWDTVQHTSCGSLADELRGIATQKLKLLKSGQKLPDDTQLPLTDDALRSFFRRQRHGLKERWEEQAVGDEEVRKEYWQELKETLAREEIQVRQQNGRLADQQLSEALKPWQAWLDNPEGAVEEGEKISIDLGKLLDRLPSTAVTRGGRSAIEAAARSVAVARTAVSATVEQSAEAQRRALAWGEQAAKLEGAVRSELEATEASIKESMERFRAASQEKEAKTVELQGKGAELEDGLQQLSAIQADVEEAKVREAELKASVKSNEERNFSLQHDLEATRALAAKTTAEHLASQRSNEAAAEAASLQTLQLQEELREAQAELQRQKSQLEEEREKLKREREGHQDKHHSHLQELHGELHRERQHLTTAHDACHTEHQQLLSSARQELEEERRKHAESKEGTKSQLLQHVRHIGSLEGKVTGLSTEANFLKGRISELQGILKESETHMVKQGQVIASLKKELEKAKGETGRTRSEGEERLYQMRREGTRRLQERVEQLSAKPSGCLPRLGPSRHGSRSGSCGSGLGLKARS